MEITTEQIIKAFNENSEIAKSVLENIQESESFKTLLTNKVNIVSQERVNEEVSNALKKAHGMYDAQLQKAGFKAIVKLDGNKEKSYEMLDRYTEEYNKLKSGESSLNENEIIKQLKADNERLKSQGTNDHYKGLYEQVKQEAVSKEKLLSERIEAMQSDTEDFKKGIEIKSAFSGLNFNPDVSESVRKMVIENIEKQLISTSKIQDGVLVYFDSEGKQINNKSTYQPKTTTEMLKSLDILNEITIKSEAARGGAAAKTITGSVEIISVEGKDTKRLNLDNIKFESQSHFIDIVNKKMSDSGITINDDQWSSLKDKAFSDYEIGKLPTI